MRWPRTLPGHPFFPLVVLLSSLTFTMVAAGLVARAARFREQATFEAAVGHTVQRIEARMQVFTALLQGAAGLFAQAEVTRKEFAEYVQRLHLDRDYIGVRGIGYSPVVSRSNREQLVEQARADGITDFEVWPANDSSFMTVLYLEPLDASNRGVLGFDMASEAATRAAIMRARDMNEPALSGHVTLKQDSEGHPGFVLYVPMFRGEEFIGVVYAPFTMEHFVSGIFAPEKDPRLAFRIYDGDYLMHESAFGYADAGQPRWRAERKLVLAGHQWTMHFLALPAFLSPLERAVAPALGVGGVLISLLLYVLARAQGEARQAATESDEARALALQQEKAARKEAEDTSAVLDSLFRATPAGLAVFDRQFRYVKLNQGLADISGLPPGQHIGRTVVDVLPDVGKALEHAFKDVVDTGEAVVSEVSGKTPNGEQVHTWLANVAPVRTGSDDIVGLAAVILDITERQRLLAALQEERETLEALNRLGSRIAAELDLEKLVQAICDDAVRLTGAQYGVCLHDVDMMPEVAVDHITRYDDSKGDFSRIFGNAVVRSYLAVPVVSRRGKAVGGLFFSHEKPNVFNERSEHLVTSLASQAAIAMDNAELFRDLQELVDELARSNRDLERSNQELDQFAYVASHDLKAPLRGIASLSEWIEEDLGDKLTPDSRRHLELLRGRVRRLENLIDGILRYARAGRHDERDERIEVARLLDEVLALLSPESHAHVRVTTPMPELRASPVELQQVFLNLISNALKYGGGDAEIRARDAGEQWEFCVSDHGPGIAPKYHDKVWGIFQTLQPRDQVEGTGIGLAVVKKIVTTRGGQAWLESEEGAGARFFFTWPKA